MEGETKTRAEQAEGFLDEWATGIASLLMVDQGEDVRFALEIALSDTERQARFVRTIRDGLQMMLHHMAEAGFRPEELGRSPKGFKPGA